SVPEHLEGVINSRIDRLAPSQQLALKVASVIGRIFAVRLLRDVYPIEPDKVHLPADLDALTPSDLIAPEAGEADLAYLFRHIITREVVYGLMTFAQRQEHHRAVAAWYERTHAADLSPFYAILAYHWAGARDESKAIDYLEKAGDQALRDGAYQE